MKITDRVKHLQLPVGSYAVFGSGPLEAHGLRDAKDLDIIVTPEYFRECRKDPKWRAIKLRDHHESLEWGSVAMFDSWAPDSWDIPRMIREAEMIDGVPFVRLETVADWKRIRNTEKDREDVRLIEEYLKTR